MAIIYTYPTVQPTVDDLILGTDVGSSNATKSFTIQSLVSIINAAAGSGTVTSVGISNSDNFLTVTNSPIIDTGTIDLKLSASGTPSASTFLRGDNTWAAPVEDVRVIVQDQGNTLTNGLTLLNFTGNGVVATDNGSGSIRVDIEGSTTNVQNIFQGTGIGVTASGGDYTISNTGVTRITAGSGIQVSPSSGTGIVTITATGGGGGGGGVGTVLAGRGLELTGGTNTLNPELGVDLTGSNNYIISGSTAATVSASDSIAFHDSSDNSVKVTTLDTIPATSLDLVKTYIDAGDANDITNATDTGATALSVPIVKNVITLTAAEYAALGTKDANTLYLTVAAAATTFNIDLTAINVTLTPLGTATGTEFTLGGDQIYPGSGGRKTLPEGSSYTFNTTISPNSGFYFCDASGNAQLPTINNATGTATAAANVTTTITGFIKNQAANNVTVTPVLNFDQVTGSEHGDFTVVGPTPSSITTANSVALTPGSFVYTQPTIAAGYQGTITYSGPGVTTSATYTANEQVTITATGGIIPIGATLPLTIVNNMTPANLIPQTVTAVSTGSFGGPTISGNVYTFTGELNQTGTISMRTNADATTNYITSNVAYTADSAPQGSIGSTGSYSIERTLVNASNPLTITVTGDIALAQSFINATVNSSGVAGPGAGVAYNIQLQSNLGGAGWVNMGSSLTGTPNDAIQIRCILSLNSGYRWLNNIAPTIAFTPGGSGSEFSSVFPTAGTTTEVTATLTNATAEKIPARVAIASTGISYATQVIACNSTASATPTNTYYIEYGSGRAAGEPADRPVIGDIIYTSSSGSIKVTAIAPNYAGLQFLNGFWYSYALDTNGVITGSSSQCNT